MEYLALFTRFSAKYIPPAVFLLNCFETKNYFTLVQSDFP